MGAHGPARSQGRHRRAERRRRDLGRAQGPDQADGRVVADAGPGGRRQPRRHGPAHGPRARGGGRLLLRHQPVRPRFAGQAPARLLLQAARLRGRARQRLQADHDRARRADRDRSGPRQGGVEPEELRRCIRTRPIDAAARHREVAQPDDGAAGAGHGHAADRGVLQAVRRLRRPAAGARHVAGLRRDHARQVVRRLRGAGQRRQAGAADPDRPHPGPLGARGVAPRQARMQGLQGREMAGAVRAGARTTTAARSSIPTPPTRSPP